MTLYWRPAFLKKVLWGLIISLFLKQALSSKLLWGPLSWHDWDVPGICCHSPHPTSNILMLPSACRDQMWIFSVPTNVVPLNPTKGHTYGRPDIARAADRGLVGSEKGVPTAQRILGARGSLICGDLWLLQAVIQKTEITSTHLFLEQARTNGSCFLSSSSTLLIPPPPLKEEKKKLSYF